MIFLERAHIILFFLALFAYGVDSGFRAFHVDEGRRGVKSPLIIAFSIHTLFLILRWIASGHAPFAGMFESIGFYAWSIAFAGLSFALKGTLDREGKAMKLASFACTIFMALAALSPKGIVPTYPALKTRWFELHVSLSFLSYGYMTLGFCSAMAWGKEEASRLMAACEKASLWGFSLFSAGMVSGGIWAYYAWGSYWIWTPKEIFSVVLWVFYGSALHAKYDSRFGQRFIRAMSVAGFCIMIFTFLGVSLLLRSSHSFR